eukprot:CAMPEP_0201283530 /NCGR_PEP_ID=MMETSP1317-20130820/8769_1 /ASSEMBLY_ACC=CAM_ASM_000770 /TAXON_ID=187299 /ORGANISM="Undescribed Undescribed, Strain Undescribed" /LENGTH=40 /DNA_ID= /DNA_START= /DNA_END= /DNA_ORIENTATION=
MLIAEPVIELCPTKSIAPQLFELSNEQGQSPVQIISTAYA